MRAIEFMVEDRNNSTNNLISVLSSLRAKTDQIRVDSLINMVRRQPGSEMFNIALLTNAVQDDSVIKNLVSGIKNDDTGVKYVYLKPLVSDIDNTEKDINVPDVATGAPPNPEKTVATMAKRAALSRT